ncbi:MAG: cardiolipin synthase ClsB [Hydrogenophilus sp.]|nr:cardiolipin synthase ClsB [Hydrogenophilus sp.]
MRGRSECREQGEEFPIARFLDGHSVQLLENGAEFFPALVAEIEQAREEFWLESYIFEADEVGEMVLAALVRAAARGVRTRVLVDGFGSFEFVRDHGERVRASGVELGVYRPVTLGAPPLRPTRMRRLHRKLACADGRVAFVGGINVVSDWRRQPVANPRSPRWDFAVRFTGPWVRAVREEMARLWRLVMWVNERRRVVVPRLRQQEAPLREDKEGVRLGLVWRSPLRHRRAIERSYLAALARAREEVWVVAAYFFPGGRFRRALEGCARRGVAVHLVLQGLSDHPWLQEATRTLYPWLLRCGVRLYEYEAAMAHAKVAVVDRRWATVGSSNIDPLSLFMAREANVWVDDRGFASLLRERIVQAVQRGGRAISEEQWGQLPWWRRAVGWMVVTGVRLAVGWAGIRGEMEG